MTLYEKIIALYPELDGSSALDPIRGSVILANDASSGFKDYIAKWEHPTLEKPTQAQLDAITE